MALQDMDITNESTDCQVGRCNSLFQQSVAFIALTPDSQPFIFCLHCGSQPLPGEAEEQTTLTERA